MPDSIQAPWRMDYIRGLSAGAPSSKDSSLGGCFLCQAAAYPDQARERLVLWTTDVCVVQLNRFPYANGHVLVSPRRHLAEFDEMTDAELLDLQQQTGRVIRLLKKTVSPQGFNVGVNLGRCAGAGVPGHLHQHVVPRWAGDINFMSVVGEVQVVPEAISKTWEVLKAEANREEVDS